MPKQLLRQSVSLALLSFVATLLFGHTRETNISAFNVVYIGSI
jgi:hypothetical protein